MLTETLKIIRAHNELSHDLERLNADQASFKEEASTTEQSLLNRLKEAQLYVAYQDTSLSF